MLSDAQLESVILAGQAHDRRLDALYRIAHDWETIERADNGGGDNHDDENTADNPGDVGPYNGCPSDDDTAERRRSALGAGPFPARLDAGRWHRLRQGQAGRRRHPR